MKKGSIFILIMLLSITFSSCTKEEATNNEDHSEKEISTEEDLEASVDEIVQVPEGYLLKENVYHNLEYFDDKIYAKYRWINPNDGEDWADALWCFSLYEDGRLIAEGRGLDFRVSKNSDFIAIELDGNIDFYNKKGEVVQTISSQILDTEEYTNVQLEEWNDAGDTLWCSLMETFNTKAYVAIDTYTWELVKYNDRDFSSEEYVLNPNTGWIVYSDYPVMLDTVAEDEFYESKKVITLSLYNLITKEEIDIESNELNRFRPRWSDTEEVLYYIADRAYFYKLVEKVESVQINSIESFYTIDKEFVDSFYDSNTKEINYDEIKLNYMAYPTLKASMGIEVINIDNVEDISPVLSDYIETLEEEFDYDGDYIKTNQDYHNFIGKQVVSESKYKNIISRYPELEEYELGVLTNDIYYEAIKYNEDNPPYFSEEVREYYEPKNITEIDWIFLDHAFRTFEGVKQLSDEELINALIEEYEFKQIKCKQYLAMYAINKIYGEYNN